MSISPYILFGMFLHDTAGSTKHIQTINAKHIQMWTHLCMPVDLDDVPCDIVFTVRDAAPISIASLPLRTTLSCDHHPPSQRDRAGAPDAMYFSASGFLSRGFV